MFIFHSIDIFEFKCYKRFAFAIKRLFKLLILGSLPSGVSKDASFFTHYYSHNVYSEKRI
jgi:hypothetical protein